MSYLAPTEFARKMVEAGESKSYIAIRDCIIRAYLAGAILAPAVVFAVTINIQIGQSIIGAAWFPLTQILGREYSIGDYLFWNEIPTVLGNTIGGIALTGLTLYSTYIRTSPKRTFPESTTVNK
jgi:formate/nitrite transporter FocA (FNT family)